MGLGNVIMQRVGAAYGKDDVKGVGGYISAGVVVVLTQPRSYTQEAVER